MEVVDVMVDMGEKLGGSPYSGVRDAFYALS